MANGLDHLVTTPQMAIGKGRVGQTEHKPGYKGVTLKVAIFFDGTLNNRTNTARRLQDSRILDGSNKDGSSSYANYYSNVAIMEIINARKDKAKHEVSVYVEGIGTQDFKEGATKKDWRGNIVPLSDAENGNDDATGYALGSGPTGITSKVIKGFGQLREGIAQAYGSKKTEKEYVEKLIIDVSGFSRGAAAARHFISRCDKELKTGWLNQGAPVLEINFVGLYDTVSSFESVKGVGGEAAMYLARLRLVPGPGGIPIPLNPHMFSNDNIFGDDVLQLGLNLGDVPKKVVHLTAQDEYRENFSLTNINTTLAAHRGVEVSLPGVHSDIGGGYTEGDPHNPHRELNKEVRRIHDEVEKQRLITEGWYKPDQFAPTWEFHTPAIPSLPVVLPTWPPTVLHTPPVRSQPIRIWEDGVRYLTHEYQFVALYLMLGFAQRGGPHLAMSFEALTGENARYQVPPDLVGVRNHFDGEVRKLDGSGGGRPHGDTRRPPITCASTEQTRWLRNHYLHRSARLLSEPKIGMAGRLDAGRQGYKRHVIPDDVRVEKSQDKAWRKTKEVGTSVLDKLDQLKSQTNRALHLLQDGAKQALEEMGKNPPLMPPF